MTEATRRLISFESVWPLKITVSDLLSHKEISWSKYECSSSQEKLERFVLGIKYAISASSMTSHAVVTPRLAAVSPPVFPLAFPLMVSCDSRGYNVTTYLTNGETSSYMGKLLLIEDDKDLVQ